MVGGWAGPVHSLHETSHKANSFIAFAVNCATISIVAMGLVGLMFYAIGKGNLWTMACGVCAQRDAVWGVGAPSHWCLNLR